MFGIPVSGGYCDVQWEITLNAAGVASMGFAVGNHLGSWVQSYMLRIAEREKDWLRQQLEQERENNKRFADAIEGLTDVIKEGLKAAAAERDRADEERRIAAKERGRAEKLASERHQELMGALSALTEQIAELAKYTRRGSRRRGHRP